MHSHLLVSNVSDASFALGVAHARSQRTDIADLISLKTFVNTEFCPRFLLDDVHEGNLGYGLQGKSVCIISTASPHHSRNELAMRNCLIAAAAKENGADFVSLVEPDLFYSAQDRGPRTLNHSQCKDFSARKKFAGQPHSSELYARMLKGAGVDQVMTVHNHKPEVMQELYQKAFGSPVVSPFINLDVAPLVANYITNLGLVRLWNYGENVGFVAPDDGASDFVKRVRELTGLHKSSLVTMKKTRLGQRDVALDDTEDVRLLKGKDVFILDDMVRTGGTIAANIKMLAETEAFRPARIFFYCTHTSLSPETRENLNSPHLNQFITTNTIPSVLNRDDQGRLRKKTVVLKLEKWIGHAISQCLEYKREPDTLYNNVSGISDMDGFYETDISSKNPLHEKSNSAQYELTI